MIEAKVLWRPESKEKEGSIETGLSFSEEIRDEFKTRFAKKVYVPERSERGNRGKD